MDNMSGRHHRGVLYTTTNGYLSEAITSAETLKENTNVHCTLITDREVNIDEFDTISISEFREDDNYVTWKIRNMKNPPYEQTICLDSDTYVVTDITPLFEVLERADLGMTQAPSRDTGIVDNIPEWFPEYNVGVMVYSNSQKINRLITDWEKIYRQLGYPRGQPALRKALFEHKEIDLFTLLPEYNVRVPYPGYVDEDIRIVHGRHDDMPDIIEKLQNHEGKSVYYFKGDEPVVKSNAETLAARARHSLKNDGIVKTFYRGTRLISRKIKI